MGSRGPQIFLLLIIQAMMAMSWKCQTEEYLSCPSNVIASAGKYVRLTCRLKNPDSLNWVFNSTNYISLGGDLFNSYNNKYNVSNDGDLEIKTIMLDSVGRYDCQSTVSGAHYYAEVYSFFSGPQCQYFKKGLDATVNCSIDYAGNADVNILLEDSRGRVLYSDRNDSKLSITNISFETPIEAGARWYRIDVDFHPKCDHIDGGECATNIAEFSKTFDITDRPPKHRTSAESSETVDPIASSPGPNYQHESPTNHFVWLILLSVILSVIINQMISYCMNKKSCRFCCKSTPESSRNGPNDQGIYSEVPSRDTRDESFWDATHALANSDEKIPFPYQAEDDAADYQDNERETMFNGN